MTRTDRQICEWAADLSPHAKIKLEN